MRRTHPRIVCGVNGSTSSGLALCEALRRAAESDARVTVVTAFDAVGYTWGALAALPGSGWLPVFDRRRIQDAEDATLRTFVDEVLADPPRALPRQLPPIELRAVPGDPVDVLVLASVDATALVVGHGEEAGPLRSVAAGCTRRARCPVIVVPARRSAMPRGAGS